VKRCVIDAIEGRVWFGGHRCGWLVMLLLIGYMDVSGVDVEEFGWDGWGFDSRVEGTKVCLNVV